MNPELIRQLQDIIDQSSSIVFFGGAGVSTESGIPDFRSVDGLYSQTYKYPPEQMLSHTFYRTHKQDFYEFYHDKIARHDAVPNMAHIRLAQLEEKGKVAAVITQNIDGLHQTAGSKNVIELHGSIHRNFCEACGAQYNLDYIRTGPTVPVCSACGGDVKPDVVLYEESLSGKDLQDAVRAIQKADALIIGGTSLVVYPAAGLVDYYEGDRMVVINKAPTHKDQWADLLIADSIGKVFEAIRV
ncbi:NAD-dependent protein deacylase [Ruminococcaceae bacterium OttesenSCG-928-O06]|nr:NAD-dependent protein deacylase [Ruminococcaceae bacterium OttesenSCG-928-O06]